MSAITATLEIGQNTPDIVMGMLRRIPQGSRVVLTISGLPGAETEPPPDLADYRARIARARGGVTPGSWATSSEAMRVLREGEAD